MPLPSLKLPAQVSAKHTINPLKNLLEERHVFKPGEVGMEKESLRTACPAFQGCPAHAHEGDVTTADADDRARTGAQGFM